MRACAVIRCAVTCEVEKVPLNNRRQLSHEKDTSAQAKRYTMESNEQSGEEEKLCVLPIPV